MRISTISIVVLLAVFISCDNNNSNEPVLSNEEQLAIDVKKIDDYLSSKGIVAQIDESGLRYVIHIEGEGLISPNEDNCITVNYNGKRLRDDFSFDSGTNSSSGLVGFIEGWQIGLQKMQIGDSATLYIPSGLAYGPTAIGSNIGKNEILYFGIKLKNIGEYYFNPAMGTNGQFVCVYD
jgi:FKBP-type peptidyl-prolyl cis-trans isomerase FkpA